MERSMPKHPILIAGAGPTGLVLALALARHNIPFRLVTEAAGPGQHSRAMAVHARTLEFYRQFGFADEVVAQGIRIGAVHLREVGHGGAGHEFTSLGFDDIGVGVSPYPFVLAYPQDDHERFLICKLEAAGRHVEWQAKLIGHETNQDGVRARIRYADGREEVIEASFLCGCDGGHSQVRQSFGVGFDGGTYDQLFHVADVRLDGPFDSDLRASLGAEILELVLPVRSSGMNRLIGLVPSALSDRDDLTFEDIRPLVEPLIGRSVAEVNWFSTYRVHHRVATRFRVGAVFLAGDAAHVHSPAGGQGMNTGIGDAVNLAWKLAAVWAGDAPDSLLDTYETERIGFARQLVATTDRAFRPIVGKGLAGEAVRRVIAPLVVSMVTRFAITRRMMFRTLSQTQIRYKDSALSRGTAGSVRGGDRLPWIASDGNDNFAPLRSLDWQVHVFASVPDALRSLCDDTGLALHRFHWGNAAQHAGFPEDGVYLVRPDGYVSVAAQARDAAEAIGVFLRASGLRFGGRAVQ
jgi:2-polyprenyl-6-methoxyphenol hydroxylase-like FAD-dependent oxidoreductase